MSDHVRRTNYLRATRFQAPIMTLTLVPTFIFCAVTSLFIFYAQRQLVDYINQTPNLQHTELVNMGGFYLLGIVWLFFAIVYVWAKIVSGKMVGAFERIIREVDMVIEGEKINRIEARDGDYIASLLLPRINSLIEKNQNKGSSVPRRWNPSEVYDATNPY